MCNCPMAIRPLTNHENDLPDLSKRKVRKKSTVFVSPVKTGVQSICNAMKTLDSGFLRNDVKERQPDFFTALGG